MIAFLRAEKFAGLTQRDNTYTVFKAGPLNCIRPRYHASAFARIWMPRLRYNRPFPSSPQPLFQGESTCKVFVMNISCDSYWTENLYRAMQSYKGLYKAKPGFTEHKQLFSAIQCYTALYRAIQGHTELYTALQSYIGLYKAIHSFTEL